MSRIERNYILRFFVDLPRKIAAVTIFRTLRSFVTFLFFSVTDGASKVHKIILRKLRLQLFVALYDFSLLFCFSHLPGGACEFNKFCGKKGKNRGRNDFSLLTIFRYILFFSLNRRHFRIEQILPKLKKIMVALYDFSLLLCWYHLPERAFEFI